MPKKPELTTSKRPEETEKQYTAWLLYCELGSIDKLIRFWKGVRLNETEVRPELSEIIKRLGSPLAKSTIKRWSIKYRWVKRTDLKLSEDLEGLKKKAQEITRKKIYIIAEAFWEKIQKLRKQVREGEGSTVHEVKELWEMLQVELGKPTSRFALKEEEQRPLTPEEEEEGREIDELIKKHHEQLRKRKYPILDRQKQHKRRKGTKD